VVLLETAEAETRLRDALRIQLPRDVVLETVRHAPSALIAENIRQAREQLARREGLLALWIAQDIVVDSEREITVYFVGRRGNRALVEVVRVRAGADEQLERAVALKALEVLEALRSAPEANLIVPFAGSAAPSPSAATSGETRGYRASMVAELGALLATPAGSVPPQVAVQVGGGAAVRTEGWRVEAVGGVRLPTPFERSEVAGTLRATEIDLYSSARALSESELFALGGFVSVGGRLVDVEGSTSAGSYGRSERMVPVLALGPEARVRLAPWLSVRGAAGLELSLRRQLFTLNGDTVIDLGRGRGVFELTLVAAPH
jgi:hypothetical protein